MFCRKKRLRAQRENTSQWDDLPLWQAAAANAAPVACLTPSRAALRFAARANCPLATALTLARIAGFPEYENV
jgi:anti-sigma-K factor RskA